MTSTSSSSSSWVICPPDSNSDSLKEDCDLVDNSSTEEANDRIISIPDNKDIHEEIVNDGSTASNVRNSQELFQKIGDTDVEQEGRSVIEMSCQTDFEDDGQTERQHLCALVRKKHEESVNYHQLLQNALEVQKCETEKYLKLENEVERLRNRLIEVEQVHNGELLELSEQRDLFENKALEFEKKFETFQMSSNVMNQQQIETLSRQLELIEAHRDELLQKTQKDADKIMKQNASFINLQCVLEQFQKDKAFELETETKKLNEKYQLEVKKRTVIELENKRLLNQIEELKLGLSAASRLASQVESYKEQLEQSKIEVETLTKDLESVQSHVLAYQRSNESKIDKSLVRNLVVNLFCGQNGVLTNLSNDQKQIVKVISAVLDFSTEDKQKLDLLSWQKTSGDVSLSDAFVKFLESESKNEIRQSKTSEEKRQIITKMRQERPQIQPQLQPQLKLPTLRNLYDNNDSNSSFNSPVNKQADNF